MTGTDVFSKEKRSKIMSAIKSKNTSPEIIVRRVLHRLGFRFRLHTNKLPGKPDIILPKYKTAIFIHGCFWHQHPKCSRATVPKQNAEYWEQKFRRNMERDKKNIHDLESMDWNVVVIWECEIKKLLDPALHSQWLQRIPK